MAVHKPVAIDLSGIDMEEVKLFVQEGGRGTPEFAASCSNCECILGRCCLSCLFVGDTMSETSES